VRKSRAAAAFVFALLGANLAEAQPFGSEAVRLRNGSVVSVKTQEQLSGGKLKAGQEVIFTVSMPVAVNGTVVIPAGTAVSGFVQDAEGSQMAGVGGQVTIALRSTTAVDGTSVPLSGQFIAKGDDQVGRNVAVGVILCPFILLDKGGEGVIPAGAETRAMTIGDYDIAIPTQPQSMRPILERILTGLAVKRLGRRNISPI
jgi:hypothetical protein